MPFFNAICARGIEVHADAGGPIYINGKEARLKTFNANYYEASRNGTTISVSINADGSPSVSYTGRGGANGVCNLSGGNGGAQPRPVPLPQNPGPSAVDTSSMPRYCAGEASAEFGVRPTEITTNMAFKSGNSYVVQGYFDGDNGSTFFNCYFGLDGGFRSVS
ncbi:hypothetical protein [Devosia sp. UYZn731]|uniref:hypothetical protein n=1 Tax=Devosia sp. UYZn731 TaxID=3156345 RepID=UPI00339910C6